MTTVFFFKKRQIYKIRIISRQLILLLTQTGNTIRRHPNLVESPYQRIYLGLAIFLRHKRAQISHNRMIIKLSILEPFFLILLRSPFLLNQKLGQQTIAHIVERIICDLLKWHHYKKIILLILLT